MMKRILLALALLFVAAPAYAVELNSDTGCDNSSAWMLGTGWTVSGSKCVGTSVSAMKMLMQMSSQVKAGHRYRMSFTVSGYSAGQVRAVVGVTMPATSPGSWVTAASVSSVADNFTTSGGLTTGPTKTTTGPGDSAELGGAFRFVCNSAGFGWIDPLVSPGQQSKHLHEFYGNNGVNKNWGFNDFRTKGSTTCGDQRDPTRPVNRTGYWMPTMLDGSGNAIRSSQIQVYYKGPSNPALNYTGTLEASGPAAVAGACAHDSPTTDCRNIPTGLRMVAGFDSATGNCGPTDTVNYCGGVSVSLFQCWDNSGSVLTASYATLEALRASGTCPSAGSGQVFFGVTFPYCWDGVNVDSPNHRDHMAYGTAGGVCPSDHPVRLPTITIMSFYPIDANFAAGKWRLASDEMASTCFGASVVAGCTLHADYWEAWSPSIRSTWFNRCIWTHNSCSVGELGDGTALKDAQGVNYDGTLMACNGCAKARPDRYVPTTRFGMSKDFTANGTYTVDMTAPDDGSWGLMGLNGFSGSLDNISIQEIGSGAKGPVTVHN